MKQVVPSNFQRVDPDLTHALRFRNPANSTLIIQVLDHHLVRVTHVPPHLASTSSSLRTHTVVGPSNSSNTTPNPDENPRGIQRDAVPSLFPCPQPQITLEDHDDRTEFVIRTDLLTVRCCLSKTDGDIYLKWFQRLPTPSAANPSNHLQDAPHPFCEDLPHRAYAYTKNEGVYHYLRRLPLLTPSVAPSSHTSSSSQPQKRDEAGQTDLVGEAHYGLGERGSPLHLNGRRFRTEASDALG
ncbi:hypothetical protein HK102_001492, partial [Quaeritorhiza haematococci]